MYKNPEVWQTAEERRRRTVAYREKANKRYFIKKVKANKRCRKCGVLICPKDNIIYCNICARTIAVKKYWKKMKRNGWKPKPIKRCIDCGKLLCKQSRYAKNIKRCEKCHQKYMKKINYGKKRSVEE